MYVLTEYDYQCMRHQRRPFSIVCLMGMTIFNLKLFIKALLLLQMKHKATEMFEHVHVHVHCTTGHFRGRKHCKFYSLV